jgi:hypothetical protein
MWIIMAWKHISTEVILTGFKKCCISNAMDRTGDDKLRNGSEEDGNVKRVGVRKIKALTVKMEEVTLIGKGRYTLTRFVSSVHETNPLKTKHICFI